MFSYAFTIIAFLICVFFSAYNCQICTERVINTRIKHVSYEYTYRESYKKPHCWFRCFKTRIASLINYRDVPIRFVETRQICCEGYMDISSVSGSLNCQPICEPSCTNGNCVTPGVCECYDGYIMDPTEVHNCKPVCLNDCPHGSCIEPNNCQCNSGYNKINETCEPICLEPCINAHCTAPDTCVCNPGYRQTEANICEPYCFSGCPNGYCVSPEVCVCNNGWVKNEENDTCVPFCTNPCGNGTCVSPNKCECSTGYEIDVNYNESSNATVCVPKCNNCVNGSCIAPNECICEPPFISKHISKIKSECPISSITCRDTICVLEESTTITYSTSDMSTISSQANDESSLYEFTTESISMRFSSDSDLTLSTFSEQETYLTERETVMSSESVTNKYNLNIKKEEEVKTEIWIYATASSLILVAMLLIILVTRRSTIAKWLKGGSYVVQEQGVMDISSPSQATMDMNMICHNKRSMYVLD